MNLMPNQPIEIQVSRDQLRRINTELRHPHLLVGGLAVQRYIAHRDSKDIDLVCDSKTAKDLIRELFPTCDWITNETNDDEYRPSYRIRHRTSDLGEIVFGPKISERESYSFIDWDDLISDAVPFRYKNEILDKVRVPTSTKLAFTKLVAFLSRDCALASKRLQDLTDLCDLSNQSCFSLRDFLSLVNRSKCRDEVVTVFKSLNKDEQQLFAKSSIAACSELFSLRPVESNSKQIESKTPIYVVATAPSSHPDPGGFRVEMEIGKDYDEYSEVELAALAKSIIENVKLNGSLRIVDKKRGSVILTIDLPASLAEKLCALVEDEQFLAYGVIGAKKIALGRSSTIECGRVADWVCDLIADATKLSASAIKPQTTFGELGVSDLDAGQLIQDATESYKVLNGSAAFEKHIQEKYSLKDVDSWQYVPVGDLCDFINRHHRMSSN